ncbi:MAG: Trk system potassium transporter TrkA [Tissierellia bacterium]|nr:Trk system potassium transporter TrkA [Tissierellia bacterium]
MKVIIVGGGKVGELLAKDLSDEADVLLIEEQPEILENLIDEVDITGFVGSGSSYPLLKEAGVATCDVFIAVTQMDELNLISGIMASKLGAKYTICRVRTPENYNSFSYLGESLGIHKLINPELEAAKKIVTELEFPFALNVDSYENNLVNMVKVSIDADSSLAGLNLHSFRQIYKSLLVCIIERGREVIIPRGDGVIKPGDHIHVTGRPEDLEKFYNSVGAKHSRVGSCLIIGGGRITHYLLSMLRQTKMKIKVIEKDKGNAELLAGDFPWVTVINADGSEKEILDREGISNYEAVVSLTGMDEENIIISMYASKSGVKKNITKVNRTAIINYLGDIGLMSIITPKRIIANRITRFVRAIENSKGSNVEALYKLSEDRVESLQFGVGSGCRVLGKAIKDLPIKDSLLIVYIIRDGVAIFPTGDDFIKEGDKVIVITTREGFSDLDDILA